MTEKLPTIRLKKLKKLSWLEKLIIALVIYPVFPFLVMFDVILEIYHQVSFRLYDVPRIPRKKYIFIDRQSLDRLGGLWKLNCMYCGYANGFAAYSKAIAAETEAFWCAIKHQGNQAALYQEQQKEFLDRKDFE